MVLSRPRDAKARRRSHIPLQSFEERTMVFAAASLVLISGIAVVAVVIALAQDIASYND